jgi:hypothetical protein
MLKIKGLYLPMLAERIVTGNVYFLGNDHANSEDIPSHGKDPNSPFDTLDYALGKMTDDNDDLLVVMANHAETITGAGGITIDKAGIQIVGMGRYDTRPTFLMDGAATVTMLVTSANVSIENIKFVAGHEDIVVFATITAKGVRFYNCCWRENTADENFLIIASVGASNNDADGFEFINNDCYQINDTSSGAVVINKDMVDVKVCGNFIVGDFGGTPYAPILVPSGEVVTGFICMDNVISNDHNDNAEVGISADDTSNRGVVVRNLVGHQDTADSTAIFCGTAGLMTMENYTSGVLGTASGYLYPLVDTLD